MPLLLRRQLVIMPLLPAALQVRERKVCFHSDLHRPGFIKIEPMTAVDSRADQSLVADEPQGCGILAHPGIRRWPASSRAPILELATSLVGVVAETPRSRPAQSCRWRDRTSGRPSPASGCVRN